MTHLTSTTGKIGLGAAAGLTAIVATAANFDEAMSHVAATGDDARQNLDDLRHTKTPRQRAEEQLAAADRQEKRLYTKARDLRAQLEAIEREHRAAVARRDHLASHPDLQQNPTSTGDTTA